MRNNPSSFNFTQHILHCKNKAEKEERKKKKSTWGESRERETDVFKILKQDGIPNIN